MGSVCLLSHEGGAAWIHNVHCVPEASTNLLSVSAAVRYGFMFVLKDHGTYARVKQKARTLLLGVDADGSVWNEAVRAAAHLHKVLPVLGNPKNSMAFTGRVPDVSELRRWGCLADVKREKHQTSTLGAQSVAGVFVGYDSQTKGYSVRVGKSVIVPRNVHFVEAKKGAIAIGRA